VLSILQTALDLLLTDGLPTRKQKPTPPNQHIPIFLSNPDFTFADVFHHPRLAQGAFFDCLATLWVQQTFLLAVIVFEFYLS
jgi:ribonucleotide monophosphatase NagD (HAD superfamily)